jgi:hypothetical protein
MKSPISALIAIGVGLVVLLGYLFPSSVLGDIQALLLQWAVFLAAFALLVGVLNLMATHWRKVRTNKPSALYSVVLIVSFVATVAVMIANKPTGRWSLWIFNHIQVPVEASLAALVAIVLVYAGVRLLLHRVDVMSVFFFITVLIVLLGTAPWYGSTKIPLLKDIHYFFSQLSTWITQTVTLGGARGILIGVALGTIATGIRILMGADRPYEG